MTVRSGRGGRLAAVPGPVRAGLWMTTAAIAYVCSIAIGKHLAPEVPVVEIAFLRNACAIAFMLPWLARAGPAALRTRRVGRHVLRGILSSLNVTLLFAAVSRIPIADMSAITFLQPVIGAAIAVVALGEAADRRRWLAIAAGFAGALVIVRPGFAEPDAGIVFALGSAFAGAVVSVLIKTLVRTDPPDTIAAWLFITQTVILAVPTAFVWTTPRAELWAFFLAIGLLSAILQRSYNRGMQAADVSIAMPFNFSRLVWAALLGWIAFGDFPDVWTWAGGAAIFAASLWLTRLGRPRREGRVRLPGRPPRR